jgi:hypothetical protein
VNDAIILLGIAQKGHEMPHPVEVELLGGVPEIAFQTVINKAVKKIQRFLIAGFQILHTYPLTKGDSSVSCIISPAAEQPKPDKPQI